MKHVPPELFGKDHWSLLAYVESCAVDKQGILDGARMRLKTKHGWKPEYGTRLRDGKTLGEHDDMDCLEDLEAAHMVEIVTRGFAIVVALTKDGRAAANNLREHKAQGGQFNQFSL